MDIRKILKDIPDEGRKFLDESIERHRLHPEISVDTYRRQKVYELEAQIKNRKLVYLDSKYWIWLRDPAASPDSSAIHSLKALLVEGVKCGFLLCPFSAPASAELMLQHPLDRRLATAKLMDDLSLGIALKNHIEVAAIEYTRFFIEINTELQTKARCILPVWTRVGALFGELYPNNPIWPDDFRNWIQKIAFDSFWCRKVEDIARLPDRKKNLARVADQIRNEREKFPRKRQSFDDLYKAELHGLLEFQVEMIEQSLVEVGNLFGVAPGPQGAFGNVPSHVLINLIREVTFQKKDPKAIPSQRIQAALHAAIRMDDNRPFKENDAEDINHAACALAYCDVFLTENSLAKMIQTKEVKSRALTNCKVTSQPKEALAVIRDLVEPTKLL